MSSSKKLFLEQRIEELETKVSELTKILSEMKHSITLKSPNGEKTISLSAADNCSGIWISGKEKDPMVAIYNEQREGAVVGIFGPIDDKGHRRTALDACLAYDKNTGGMILLTDKDNNHHFIDGKDADKN